MHTRLLKLTQVRFKPKFLQCTLTTVDKLSTLTMISLRSLKERKKWTFTFFYFDRNNTWRHGVISVAVDVMNDVIVSQGVLQPSPGSRFFVQPADQVSICILKLDKLILDWTYHLYQTPETRELRFWLWKSFIAIAVTFLNAKINWNHLSFVVNFINILHTHFLYDIALRSCFLLMYM